MIDRFLRQKRICDLVGRCHRSPNHVNYSLDGESIRCLFANGVVLHNHSSWPSPSFVTRSYPYQSLPNPPLPETEHCNSVCELLTSLLPCSFFLAGFRQQLVCIDLVTTFKTIGLTLKTVLSCVVRSRVNEAQVSSWKSIVLSIHRVTTVR